MGVAFEFVLDMACPFDFSLLLLYFPSIFLVSDELSVPRVRRKIERR